MLVKVREKGISVRRKKKERNRDKKRCEVGFKKEKRKYVTERRGN